MALGNMNIGVDSEFIPSNLNTVLWGGARGEKKGGGGGGRGGWGGGREGGGGGMGGRIY